MQAFVLRAATGVLLDRAAGLVLKIGAGLACVTLLLGALAAATVVSVLGVLLPLPPLEADGMGRAGGAEGTGTLALAARVTRPSLTPNRAFDATGAAAALEVARTQSGRPYVWGGASPETSFDCSGLVQWSFGRTGAPLPRTAQQQFDATAALSPAELRPGDLVFFAGTGATTDPREWISHVGIYAGHGQMISAESGGVREAPVFSGYWARHYAGAGRVRS